MWLNKYQLTQKEIEENDIYSCGTDLVFVCTGGTGIVGFQRRPFPEARPKYITKGNVIDMSMSVLGKESGNMGFLRSSEANSMLYFVEDRISAIKLARYAPTVPLFGAHLAVELIERLSNRFKHFRLWLDPDKRKDAFKQCLNLKQKGFLIEATFSNKDPKEHTDEEIKNILS